MARIYLSPPDLAGNELELLRDALESNWIAPLGPHVDAFEAEMASRVHVPHALALSSGTAALHLALEVLGVGVGDEVWMSTLTFAATANATTYVRATPVFVDSVRASWNLDPALLGQALDDAAKVNRLPKAVIAVDLYGQCADFEPITAACQRHGVLLIEDAAEGLGATYQGRPAGSFADLSILSFNGNKIITTSGGGMLLGRRKEWIDRARYLATQARSQARHYEHEAIGFNYRMSNLLAAVGRAQLADLERRVTARRATNAAYRRALGHLPGWAFMPAAPGCVSTFWLTCAEIDAPVYGGDRDTVIDRLAAADIEARPVWKPMHLQPIFAGARCIGGSVAESLFERGICLPSGSNLDEAQRTRVVDAILAGGHAQS
ncbi:MAG: aminotransferase class I/II-fold pyridoxal phosphate-dependent enzyme [Myxococcales bacterium]|nr:aminotransferase class I/II-fold pyridoxal phosphate-dependent enzyme [Myxococcales bacterium]